MSRDNETNQEVIVFNNLRRPSGDIAGNTAPVKAKAFQPTESFVCSNAPGCTRVVDSLDEIGELANSAGSKFRASFGG
jgi:hypothetical protein